MFKITKIKKHLKVIFDFIKLTKEIILVLIILISLSIVYYSLERVALQDPFLESITLSNEVIDTGTSKKIFTDKIRDNVQNIINSFSKNKKIVI